MWRGSTCLVLLVAISCGGTSAQPEEPSGLTRISSLMHNRLLGLEGLQAAVVQGDLERAKREAADLSTMHVDEPPASWTPHLDSLRSSLTEVSRAINLQAAATATARAAQACGSCHAEHRVEDAMPSPGPAPSTKPHDLSEQMWQHSWSANRLWAGVAGPSEDSWRSGAEQLSRAELLPSSDVQMDEWMQNQAQRMQELKAEVKQAATGEARTVALGRFLATCASCHNHYFNK
jgi:hypothetical protein